MAVASLTSQITLALNVRDRHASAKWFEEMFGFCLLFHADDVGWSEMTTLTEGVTLGLAGGDGPASGDALIIFGTADLDRARTELEAAGVHFKGETMEVDGMVKLATFLDPDKNEIMLAQDLTV